MTNKICPNCKTELLENILFHNIEADYCKKCLGLWFEEDELRQSKDSADMNLNWLDTDLWKEIKNFIIARDKKLCPECRLPLYEVDYGKSAPTPQGVGAPIPRRYVGGSRQDVGSGSVGGVSVDLCNVCHGIWLDRGEFQRIMEYLKKEGAYETLNDYSKKLLLEFWEIFTGPETLREEVSDFLTLSKFLQYKFSVQHPDLSKIISQLPK